MTKLERMALLKARTGKASKSWLKAAAAESDAGPAVERLLDAAFPGWRPRRGISGEDQAVVDDISLAYDLNRAHCLEPRLQAHLDAWVDAACVGTLEETLWRHLDDTLGPWAGKLGNKRTTALRLRAVQLRGFRLGAGRDPAMGSDEIFERSLAGWLRRNRAKDKRGTLGPRDANIILGRIGSWTREA